MPESERWIATVDENGTLLEVKRYHGHDDDGCVHGKLSYGESIQAIARTAEDAESKARRCWELAQDPEPAP